jgi:hypothetical protein
MQSEISLGTLFATEPWPDEKHCQMHYAHWVYSLLHLRGLAGSAAVIRRPQGVVQPTCLLHQERPRYTDLCGFMLNIIHRNGVD